MSNALLIAISGSLRPASAAPSLFIVQQAVNQYTSGAVSVTLGAAPTVGNTLVAYYISGNYSAPTAEPGWTLVGSSGGTSAAGYYAGLYTHTVVSGDTTTVTPTSSTSNSQLAVWEVTGNATAALANAGKLTTGSNTATLLGGAAPAATSIPVAMIGWQSSSPNSLVAWPAGWTAVGPNTLSGYPYYGVSAAYEAATSGAVSAPVVTWTGSRGSSQPADAGLVYISAV